MPTYKSSCCLITKRHFLEYDTSYSQKIGMDLGNKEVGT